MFRRTIWIVALAVALTPLAASQAGASARVEESFHGPFAEGAWRTSPASFGWTLVARGLDGITHLSVHQYSDAVVNEDGDVTSGSVLTGEATSGVSFMIDTVHYTGASVSGTIPVDRCTIVDGVETNCVDAGTMGLASTWVGVGPIPHFPETGLWWDDCLYVDRSSSVEREATMAVNLTLNGAPVSATQDGFTGFGKGNNRLIVACTG
jgi:hypothetical protein